MRPSLETAFLAALERREAGRFRQAAACLPFLVDPAFRRPDAATAPTDVPAPDAPRADRRD